jgi:hypothetical protein
MNKQRRRQNDLVLHMVQTVRGTAPRIAEVCGINREAVWQWQQVPAKHVLNVEELLDIPRHLIRPDIYPPPRRRRQNGGKAA